MELKQNPKRKPDENGWEYKEYPKLISTVKEITCEVKQTIHEAFEVRDRFFEASCHIIDGIASVSATKSDIRVNDRYEGIILVERKFISKPPPNPIDDDGSITITAKTLKDLGRKDI